MQSVVMPGNPTYIYGYYPCDNPPTVGFSFPAQSDIAAANSSSPISRTAKTFNIPKSAFQLADNGNNNCTAVLMGTDQFYDSTLR